MVYTHNLRVFIVISFFIHVLAAFITLFLPSLENIHQNIQTKIRVVSLPPPLQREWNTLDFTRKKVKEETPDKGAALSWKNSTAHAKNRGSKSDRYKDVKDILSYGKSESEQVSNLERDRSTTAGNSDDLQYTKRVVSKSGIQRKKRGRKKKQHTESIEKNLQDKKHNAMRQRSDEKKISQDNAPISLETREFKFMPYFSKIFEKINHTYTYPTEALMNGDTGNVYVQFFVNNAGVIDNVSIYRSSGFPSLDQESLRAVRDSSPLPPIPNEIGRKRLNIVATFKYQMNFDAQ